MVGLSDSVKNFEDIYNRLDSIPACDGQTDGQTFCNSIVRAMHTRRAVKMKHVLPYNKRSITHWSAQVPQVYN